MRPPENSSARGGDPGARSYRKQAAVSMAAIFLLLDVAPLRKPLAWASLRALKTDSLFC
jgi:hypothetical protein